ncbi:MAG: DUF4252 domain-containing protein [Bacteroidales bacterium]|nr:DUF4252 domain-containing protein [Bacteroidales bacterium]
MKKSIIILIVIFAFPILINAQNSPVEKLFEKYTGEEGFTSVDVSQQLFGLFTTIESDDEGFEEFQKAISQLEGLKLLSYTPEEPNSKKRTSFYNDIINTVPFKEYKELMIIRENDMVVKFYVKHEKEIISELIMIANGDDETVLMNLSGIIDLNSMAKLAGSMNIHGMNHLGKIEKKEK